MLSNALIACSIFPIFPHIQLNIFISATLFFFVLFPTCSIFFSIGHSWSNSSFVNFSLHSCWYALITKHSRIALLLFIVLTYSILLPVNFPIFQVVSLHPLSSFGLLYQQSSRLVQELLPIFHYNQVKLQCVGYSGECPIMISECQCLRCWSCDKSFTLVVNLYDATLLLSLVLGLVVKTN